MNLIDTHCHLDVLDDLNQVIDHANKMGVKTILAPATDAKSAVNLLSIANMYENVYVMVGIHPEDCNIEKSWDYFPDFEVNGIEEMLEGDYRPMNPTAGLRSASTLHNGGFIKKIVGIGECGLDFKYAETDEQKQIQIQLFKQHVKWSRKYNLPLVIHNRKAGKEIISIINEQLLMSNNGKSIRGVFHCFAGSKKLGKKIIDELPDFYFGFGGLVTIDQGNAEVAKTIPLEKIVVETDSPYLTPKPIKESKPWPNTPANVKFVVEKLAELKSVSIDEVAKITSENARNLFGI